MIRVDAHHHVWTIARGDYRWLSPDLSIARDYGLDDLRPLLGDITVTVLVQAADTEAETAFMLDVARGSARGFSTPQRALGYRFRLVRYVGGVRGTDCFRSGLFLQPGFLKSCTRITRKIKNP